MDTLLSALISDLDGQTFAVALAVFVVVEVAKLFVPALTADKRGEHILQVATMALGLLAGVVLLRGQSVVFEESIVTGLRRGASVAAFALLGWHVWRLTIRALWRRFRSVSAPSASGAGGLKELDPVDAERRAAAKRRTRKPAPRGKGGTP